MRFVRGRADARFLPSRHNAALFRLAAYLRLRNAKPEPSDGVLVIERYQSAFETWTVGSWIIGTIACFVAATLFASWPIPLAILAAVPLTIVGLELPLYLIGLTITPLLRAHPTQVNSLLFFAGVAAAAAYFATRPSWVRFVGWQFLALLALNAIAAVIVFLLRDPIARLEASVTGGPASAP